MAALAPAKPLLVPPGTPSYFSGLWEGVSPLWHCRAVWLGLGLWNGPAPEMASEPPCPNRPGVAG